MRMATSEYIRNRNTENRGQEGVSRLHAAARRSSFGPTAAAAAAMVINDLLMILVAFGMAMFLRTIAISRFAPMLGLRPTLSVSGLEVAYFGWFVLVYVVVARRYG